MDDKLNLLLCQCRFMEMKCHMPVSLYGSKVAFEKLMGKEIMWGCISGNPTLYGYECIVSDMFPDDKIKVVCGDSIDLA